MKGRNVAAALGGIALVAVGAAMAITNPSQDDYETFATQQLTGYLQENVCVKAPSEFGLQRDCQSLLKSKQSEIREFVATGTEQQNFIFFSIYRTNLSLTSWLPSYRFETIAVFDRFYLYEAKQN